MEIEGSSSETRDMHGSLFDRVRSVGKKIVITGIVVSSAPIVLPPLMLFSTLGIAFAVPFGFAFMGYACTVKIMSSLFPRPGMEVDDYQPLDLLVVRGCDGEMKVLEDKVFAGEKESERAGDGKEEEDERVAEEGDENENTQEEEEGEIEQKREEKSGISKIDGENDENVLDLEKGKKEIVVECRAVVMVECDNGGYRSGFENGERVEEEKNVVEDVEDEKTQVEIEGEREGEEVGNVEEEERVVEEGDGNENTQEGEEGGIEEKRDDGEVGVVEKEEKSGILKIDGENDEDFLDQEKGGNEIVVEFRAAVMVGCDNGGFENEETVEEEKNVEEDVEDENTQVEIQGKMEEKREGEEVGNVEEEERVVEGVGNENTQEEEEGEIEEKSDDGEVGFVEKEEKSGVLKIDGEGDENVLDQEKGEKEIVVEYRAVVMAECDNGGYGSGFENEETVEEEKNIEEDVAGEKTQVVIEGKIEEKSEGEEVGNVEGGGKEGEVIIDDEEEGDGVDQDKEEAIVEYRTVVVVADESGDQGQVRCFENGERVAEEKNVEDSDEGEKTQVDVEGEVEEKIDAEEVVHVEGGEKEREMKIDDDKEEEEENLVDQEKEENEKTVEIRTSVVVLSENGGEGREFENRETENIEENDEKEKTQEVAKEKIEEQRDAEEVGNVGGRGKEGEMKIEEEEDNAVNHEKEANGMIGEDKTVVMVVSDNGGAGRSFENGQNHASAIEVTDESKCPWVWSNNGEEAEKAYGQFTPALENSGEVKQVLTPDSAYYSAQPVDSVAPMQSPSNSEFFSAIEEPSLETSDTQSIDSLNLSVSSYDTEAKPPVFSEAESPSNSEFFSAIEEPSLETSDTQSIDSLNHSVSSYDTEAKPPVFSEAEDLYNEEKIWEQINAMRTIVGYKAALNSSCMEELNALYMFTGVEPPTSSKDSPDLVEVNYKLRFLKSVVGVI